MSQAYSSTADWRGAQVRGFLEDVEQLARSAGFGRPWPRLGQVEGCDPSGTVYFAIDDDGAFASIHLDPRWWPEIGVDGLSAAVRDAQQNAYAKLGLARLTCWRVMGPPPPEPAHLERRPRIDHDDREALVRSWEATTAESYQRIYEYERRAAQGTAGETVVAGPGGLVRITLAHRTITRLEVAGWGLSGESTEALAADIRAALHENGGVGNA